jgi:endonuclease I
MFLRIILITSITLFNSFSWAKITQADYQLASKQSGYKLKSALNELLRKNHKTLTYDELVPIFLESDRDTSFDQDGTIVDIYSENPHGHDPYRFASRNQMCGSYRQESDCFNREHVFPQGIFKREMPMKSDIFHIYPTDGYVNSKRGSYPFGEVGQASWVSKNGSKLGENTFGRYSGTVFEPIDEFKGDIARALLYFATRYEHRMGGWNHPMLNGTKNQVYADWFIALLLKWHKMDPVSEHERKRNNIAEKYQGNRNPFIDHPEWVERIWGKRI